ncbi:response regulator [Maribacter aurantiacus]|uniref:Response regulator n=1 Tax=Maribacter aurantiacus TaxID=1882343 RepID=A0A5R8MC06_9FLAO|nr:response regulator [Maribacter aurantiacus]TLF47094.1 response regulator [Maribacter aurantiacus]
MSQTIQRIYLADDDSDDRAFFSDALGEIPIATTIEEFSNGVDLMSFLLNSEHQKPDAIFLDLKMPMMDGFECLADIRDLESFSNIPVIIYSTSFHEKDVERLKKMGATLYLKKPSSFNQLKTLLHKCLSHLAQMSKGTTKIEPQFLISI